MSDTPRTDAVMLNCPTVERLSVLARRLERDIAEWRSLYAEACDMRVGLLEAAKIGLSCIESDYTGRGGRDLSGGAAGKVRDAIAKAEGK